MRKKGPQPVDRHVGARIRMRRLQCDMTQTKLGDRLGVTFQQVQKYENGMNRVGASRLHQIAQALGVDIEFFFEGSESTLTRAAVQVHDFTAGFLATPDGLTLCKAFVSIKNKKARRAIVQMVARIAELDNAA